jgi:hypothetical protein
MGRKQPRASKSAGAGDGHDDGHADAEGTTAGPLTKRPALADHKSPPQTWAKLEAAVNSVLVDRYHSAAAVPLFASRTAAQRVV